VGSAEVPDDLRIVIQNKMLRILGVFVFNIAAAAGGLVLASASRSRLIDSDAGFVGLLAGLTVLYGLAWGVAATRRPELLDWRLSLAGSSGVGVWYVAVWLILVMASAAPMGDDARFKGELIALILLGSGACVCWLASRAMVRLGWPTDE
jgi:hypothetical protein